MKTDASQDRLDQRTHEHHTEILVGNGSKTEFLLEHRIADESRVQVYVNGNRYRPNLRGGAQDFQIRGVTPGYVGEQNAVKFAVAPLNLMDVVVDIIV